MNSISIKTQFGWISVFEKKGQIIKVREGKCKTKSISVPLKKFKKGLKNYLRKKNKTIKSNFYIKGNSIQKKVWKELSNIKLGKTKSYGEIAKKYKADAVAHGATGKGNDQIRFELGYYYFNRKIKVISPWREWDFKSRSDLIKYAKNNNISVPKDKKGEAPFSVDDNLFHTSTEGKILEDLSKPAPEYIYQRTFSPEKATNRAENCSLTFSKGNLIAVNNKKNEPKNLLKKLNDLGKKHGIGRVDLVENRFIGIKSRGVYETPGGTILLFAHRAIESITLKKDEQHTKDEIMPKYAELIYNGYWFSKERKKLQSLIDKTQKNVDGTVKLKLYKGNVIILERHSKKSLYSKDIASFEETKNFDPKFAEKFIKKKRY